MPFIEAPTTFYLGRRYDPVADRMTNDVVYYDSRDLTTHAIVVGMTGSGKTGLCINLLEEAILDNIPAIVVDPKGDITNLLLNFPDLRPQDFQPWVNVDDARRAGLDVPQYAADVAHQWKEGLAGWGIVPDRMRWLKYAARYSIYTPGSDAGLPISILASLRAPREGWAGNEEALREKINGITTALLALIGRSAQPVQDKEHVLIANIFEHAWRSGQDLTLEDIILQVQRPPFAKLGVFPLDEYISERNRAKLAMELNNIVAAPSFQSWLNGDPMDVHSLLYTKEGRPRVSIFYIAHLSESERQFIITLLLENILGWMRTLSGTTSLRALLYIDEMFGYFPPYPRNPPTKEPILRLLKQARAFGLGMILATQNPGDLDYKGLSNAGTWFIGRLQSENDMQKVITGLQSMTTTDSQMTLNEIARMIPQIRPRTFVMHNVHDNSGAIMLHTRWAMSYLRGPLTKQQVQILMADQRSKLLAQIGAYTANFPAQPTAPMPPQSTPASGGVGFAAQMAQQSRTAPPPALPEMPSPPAGLPEIPRDPYIQHTQGMATAPLTPTQNLATGYSQSINSPPGFSPHQPPVTAAIPQYFLAPGVNSDQATMRYTQRMGATPLGGTGGSALAYKPYLLAQVAIRFSDRRIQTYIVRQYSYLVPDVDRSGLVRWEESGVKPLDIRRISGEPHVPNALFGDLPSGLTDAKRLTTLKRELVDMMYATVRLQIPFNSTLDLYANPDQDLSVFQAQLQQAARERRDVEMDALTAKYEGVINKLDDNERRKIQQLEAEKRELSNLKREQLFTTGEAVLGLLNGRTSFTLSRMSRAAVYKERSKGQKELHEFDLQQIADDREKSVREYEAAVAALNEKWAKIATTIEYYPVTPYKKDITVELFGIGWIPFWYSVVNGQPLLLPAAE
jgi:hypothetical protein